MGTLNKQAVQRRDMIKNAGYNHEEVYACKLNNNKDSKVC